MIRMQRLIKSLDTLIYGFVAPFGVLYVFPRFFLGLEQNLDIELPRILALKYTGVLLMNLGGLLAITCALFMHTRKSGTISPFVRPTELVRRGPYACLGATPHDVGGQLRADRTHADIQLAAAGTLAADMESLRSNLY
ncbi:hypothetical protein ACYCFC_11475 [Stutzerimonas sp. NM35]